MLEINSDWNSKWIAFNFNLIRILIFHAMLTIESNLFISNPVKCEAINSRDGRNKFLSIFTIFFPFSLSPLLLSNSPRIVLALTRKIAHQGEKIFACHKYSKKVSKIEVPKSTRVIMRIVWLVIDQLVFNAYYCICCLKKYSKVIV